MPLKHPVNIAYEAATADLKDINMIDPFHLEKYNINDELVIKKTYWYRIDRETGERTLEKVTYNE